MWSADDIVADFKDLKATAAAIDASGRFVVLAGRLGTSVVDLHQPDRILHRLSRKTKYDISTIAWNHNPAHSNLIAVGCNQNIELLHFDHNFHLSDPHNSIKGHSRAVLDIDWCNSEPNLLVSCSTDNFVYVWDVKDLRRPVATLTSLCGASQAKWSKVGRNLLATAHDAECKLWDFRKASTPMLYIAAHSGKINGLDWSGTNGNQLVTCSQDCHVKVWDIESVRQAKLDLPTSAPVWRARFTPFGDAGLVTIGIAQLHRGDANLTLWGLSEVSSPLHYFAGHSDGIYDFFWRSPRPEEYQLVSWSKDQTLRLWKLDPMHQRLCSSSANSSPMVFSAGLTMRTNPFRFMRDFKEREFEDDSGGEEEFLGGKEVRALELPGLTVEEIDVERKMCSLTITALPHVVRMTLTFPDGYPETNAPGFNVLPESTLNLNSSRQLVQAVQDTFSRCLQSHTTSIAAGMRTVQQFLVNLSTELTPSPRLEAHPAFISPPIRNPPSYKSVPSRYIGPQRVESPLISAATAKLLGSHATFTADQPMPFPRILGGCFAADKLVVWSDAWKLGFTPRTSRSLLENGPSVYASDLAAMQRATRKLKKGKFEKKSITVYNVSSLLTIDPQMAAQYSVDSADKSGSFSHNIFVAETNDRPDIAAAWKVLQLAVPTTGAMPRSDLDDAPWAMHPLGGRMVNKIIDHFRDAYDSSFLASLACILQEPLPPPAKRPASTSVIRKSSSAIGSIAGQQGNSGSPGQSSIRSDDLFDSIGQFSLGRRDGMANYTKAAGLNQKKMEEEQRKNDEKILGAERECETRLFKKELCDLLYVFGEHNKRIEILKNCDEMPDPHRGLEYSSVCRDCKSENRGARCMKCKYQAAVLCAFCHLPVRGLSTFCPVCLHGGHAGHMVDWFSVQKSCPAGCGCICKNPVQPVFLPTRNSLSISLT